ncbi:MAG: xanthine dehydrogenase family protein subunit M [Alphaproteobacteria bacterium]|nr:xanthine dehydrogenase family protein subunit M [Alphaproteobacteria bacterium]
MLGEFDLEIPDSMEEALEMLATADAPAPLAGGTNMLVDMRAGAMRPERVVSLARLGGMRWIEERDSRIAIGGGTTVSDLLRDKRIAVHGASLVEAARVFAGQMVRNTATVAGNVAYGSPAADLVPPLMVLDAEVTLMSKADTRTVPLADYFTGYKQTVRKPDELIAGIAWPKRRPGMADLFYKLARRKGDAITMTGVAVALSLERGKCAGVRIALGAVAPTVVRACKAEAMLEGQAPEAARIEEAARQAAQECEPIDDVRGSADYRRHTVHMLVRRLVGQAIERLR